MNRIAFSTAVPAGESGDRLLAMIAEAGFDGVEPVFLPDNTWPSSKDPMASAEALRRAAERHGLAIPSMRGGPGFWPTFGSSDSSRRQQAVELADQALASLPILGADVLLVVPGQWDAKQTYEAFWDHSLETARGIAQVAKRRGLMVALENVENQFLLSPREWIGFLEQVGSSHVRMYFDVGNVIRNCQGHPQQWIRQLGRERICRVHFKDARAGVTPIHLLEGEVNWTATAQALRGIRYDGWIGVEMNLPPHYPAAMLKGQYIAARAIAASAAATAD